MHTSHNLAVWLWDTVWHWAANTYQDSEGRMM